MTYYYYCDCTFNDNFDFVSDSQYESCSFDGVDIDYRFSDCNFSDCNFSCTAIDISSSEISDSYLVAGMLDNRGMTDCLFLRTAFEADSPEDVRRELRFRNCDLSNLTFKVIDCVTFDDCTLGAFVAIEAVQCRFIKCTSLDVYFEELKDCLIVRCQWPYIFSANTVTETEIRDCNLKGAKFSGGAINDLECSNCNLDKAIFERLNINLLVLDECSTCQASFIDSEITGLNIAFDLVSHDLSPSAEARSMRFYNGSICNSALSDIPAQSTVFECYRIDLEADFCNLSDSCFRNCSGTIVDFGSILADLDLDEYSENNLEFVEG